MDKKITGLLVCILIFLGAAGSIHALGIPERVDVYPRGADVTWKLTAESEMVVELPSSFSHSRISYSAQDGAEVKHFQAEYGLAENWEPTVLQPLLREIKRVKSDIGLLEANLQGIGQTISYLADHVASGSSLGDPLEFFVQAQELRIELEQKRQSLEQTKKEAEKELRELNSRLSQAYGGDTDRKLVVRLSTNGLGTVELTSFTEFAGWAPLYRVALDTDESLMILDSFIGVYQRSGIDFKGTIYAHTSQPQQQIALPRLDPLVARIYKAESQPESLGLVRMALSGADLKSPVADTGVHMAALEHAAGIVYCGRGVVPSDNQEVLLSLGSQRIPMQIFPTLVPFYQKEAWLSAESDQPVGALLPGSAEFTVDGYLTGKSMISHPGGDATLALRFGKTPLITATRESIVYTERKTWLGRHIRRDGYRIKVSNAGSYTAEIEVIDRIPVSGHDRLRINVEIDPVPYEENDGILTWLLTLEPGESKTIFVEYELDYPDDMELDIS